MGKFFQLIVLFIFAFCGCLALSNTLHAAPFAAVVTDFSPLNLDDTQDDDTQAVQNAINKAESINGIVFFPAGTYNVKTIIVRSSVTLMGEGAGSVIKQLNSFEDEKSIPILDVTMDGERVYIDLLTFDGNNSNVHPNNIIVKVDAEGTVTSNAVLEVSRTAFLNQANNSLRFNGRLENVGREHLIVRDCIFQGGNVGGIDYAPRYIEVYHGPQIVITDNLFDFMHTLDPNPEIHEVGISAIIIAALESEAEGNIYSSAIIKGNIFRRLGRDTSSIPKKYTWRDLGVIDFYRRGKNIIISDNTFENSTATAVRGKSDVRRLMVVNNLIDKANGLGVYITRIHKNILNSGEIIIEGNIIKDVHGGIRVIGNGGREDNSDKVDWLWNVSIRGNIIDRATDPEYWGYGIKVRRLFSFDILHNRISDTERHGIWVDWSIGAGNISQNMIFKTNGDGIRVDPPSEGRELRINFLGNHIENATNSGISAQKITIANIQGNHINKANRAIELYSTFGMVKDNIATNVGTELSITGTSIAKVHDNSWQ